MTNVSPFLGGWHDDNWLYLNLLTIAMLCPNNEKRRELDVNIRRTIIRLSLNKMINATDDSNVDLGVASS